MLSRRASGFTLPELIVVIAIIVTVSSIVYPTIISARRSASEVRCISNLRQLYVALELYRENWQGSAVGTPSQMGLPPAWWRLAEFSPQKLTCAGLDPTNCDGNAGYYAFFPPALPELYTESQHLAWSTYVQRFQSESVLFVDANHAYACPVTEYSTGRAIGVRLNGSAKLRVRFGDPLNPTRSWWHD